MKKDSGQSAHLARRALQFKITLAHIQPAIWRRVVVPGSYSFWDLHVAIQDAMGWLDYHLHEFAIRSEGGDDYRIGIPDPDGEFPGSAPTMPGWQVKVRNLVNSPAQSFLYVYDFGDNWEHEVVLEEVLPRRRGQAYPQCSGGERACPPEDCGGIHGYQELLTALANPVHPERAEYLQWLGGAFDSEHFDPGKVCFDDPKARWNDAFTE